MKEPGSWHFLEGSIRFKILVPVALLLALPLAAISIYAAYNLSREARLNLGSKARILAEVTSFALAEGVEFKDPDALKPIIEGLSQDPEVTSVAVFDGEGKLLAGRNISTENLPLDKALENPFQEIGEEVVVTREIKRSRAPEAPPADDEAVGPPHALPKVGERVGALRLRFSRHAAALRAEQARLSYVGLSAGAFVLTLILLAYVLERLIRPIRALTDVTQDIVTRGDLTRAIDVTSRDEIGQLASTFGQMVERLREIPMSLRASTELLTTSVLNLTGTTTEQKNTISGQAAALQETQVTVQEIKQTSLLAAQKAEAVLKVAERADEISRQGESALEQSLGGLSDIRAQVGDIAQKITELSERTRQIGLITETVKDLADQSNMLALNAAIEAVRSGEHGKGFGVVAREIRSLADQSIQATVRVREILDDISAAIRMAVSITERGSQKVEGSLVQLRGSGENLRELSNIVRDNSSAVRQIAAAVSQQNAGITQIFSAVSELNQMMDDTVKRLESTNQAVVVLQDVSDRVSTVVRSFRV